MSFNKTEAVRNAEKFLAAGKIKQAVTEYQQIVKRDPEDITNVNLLGDLLVKCGETQDALQNFCKVAEHYAQKGFPQKAVAVYNKILRLRPECVDTLAKLAELNRQKGANAEARVQYGKLAEVYEKNDETKKLLMALRALAAMDKQGSKHLMKIGEVCRKASMKRDAADAFAEAGDRYLAQEQVDAALDAFSKALEQESEHAKAFQGYVRISLLRGTSANAIEKLEDILNEQPENSELRELLAQCYQEMGEEAKAEEILMGLVSQNPERYKLLLGILDKHLENQDARAAMRIIAVIADRLLSDEKPDEVLRWTNLILDLEPENLEAMRLQARFFTSKGDVLSATTILERIAVLASRSVAASAPEFPSYGGATGVEPYGFSNDNDSSADGYPPVYGFANQEVVSETGIAPFDVQDDEEVEPAREFVPSADGSSGSDVPSAEGAGTAFFDDATETAREYTIEDAGHGYTVDDSEAAVEESDAPSAESDESKDMGLAVSGDRSDGEGFEAPAFGDSDAAFEPAAETVEDSTAEEASYGFEILAITETKLVSGGRDRNTEAEAIASEESVEEKGSLAFEGQVGDDVQYPTPEELAAEGFGEDGQEMSGDDSQPSVIEDFEVADRVENETDYSVEFGEHDPDSGETPDSGVSVVPSEIVFDTHQSDESDRYDNAVREDLFLSTADEFAGMGEGSESSDDGISSMDSRETSQPIFAATDGEVDSQDIYGAEDVVPDSESVAEDMVPTVELSEEYSFESVETVETVVSLEEYSFETKESIETVESLEDYSFETEESVETVESLEEYSLETEESVETVESLEEYSFETEESVETVESLEEYSFETEESVETVESLEEYSFETAESIETVESLEEYSFETEESVSIAESEETAGQDSEVFDVSTETVHYVAFEYSDQYANGNGNGNGHVSHTSEAEPKVELVDEAVSEPTFAEVIEPDDAGVGVSDFSDSFETRIEELVAQMNFELAFESEEPAVVVAASEDRSVEVDLAESDAEHGMQVEAERGPAVFIPAEDYDPKDLQGFILRTDFRGRLFLTEFSLDAFTAPDFIVELPDESFAWLDLSDTEIDEAVYPKYISVDGPDTHGFAFVEIPAAAEVAVEAPKEVPAAVPTPLAKVIDDREKKLMHLLEGVEFFLSEGFFEVAQQSLQSISDEYGDRAELAPFRERIEMFISHAAPEEPIAPASSFSNSSLLSKGPQPYDPDFPELDALGTKTPDDIRRRDEVVEIDEETVFDFETCYDTATAYREMGLLDYAVREFENALKLTRADDGSRRFFQCCTMLGHCFMDYGKPDLAVTWFRRAQETPGLSEEEDLAVLYEIANALESHGKTVEAAKLFGHINASSLEYRDASQRFYRLRNGL